MTEENNKSGKRLHAIGIGALILLLIGLTVTIVMLMIQQRALTAELADMHEELLTIQSAWNETSSQTVQSDADETVLAEQTESRVVWEDVSEVSNGGVHKVYLTFDDGPSAQTDAILDILDEYGVKATFFVVGKEGYEEQYRRIVEEGHSLGIHSYSHKYRDIYQSLDAYREDLERLHSYLYEVTGVDSRIVRFPGGSSNAIGSDKIQELIAYLDDEGFTYYDWNVSSGDAASGYVSASRIESNVLDNVGRFDTSIVLMHDSSDKDTTLEALPVIIETLLASEDTVLLPITESTVPIQHVTAQ